MTNALMESLTRVWNLFREKTVFFVPRLLAVVVVLLAGWLAATLVRMLVLRLLNLLQLDVRCERAGFSLLLRKAGIPSTPCEVFSRLAFWCVLLSAAVFSLSALEMAVLDRMVAAFFLFIPNLILAAIILVLGFAGGNFLSRAALLAATNREFPSARIIAETVRVLVNLLALAMALEQLGIARGTVTAAFSIAFGGVMFGLALAFGIGGRDLARELLERRFAKKNPGRPDDLNHL